MVKHGLHFVYLICLTLFPGPGRGLGKEEATASTSLSEAGLACPGTLSHLSGGPTQEL